MIKFTLALLPTWVSKFEHFNLLVRHGILPAQGKQASASVEPCFIHSEIDMYVFLHYNARLLFHSLFLLSMIHLFTYVHVCK